MTIFEKIISHIIGLVVENFENCYFLELGGPVKIMVLYEWTRELPGVALVYISNGISDLCRIAIVVSVIIHYKSCELILTEDFF